MFESRKEARKYRRENKISGQIKQNDDGSYSIHDKEHAMTYSTGDDSQFGGDLHPNDGVVESALAIGQASGYGANQGGMMYSNGDAENDSGKPSLEDMKNNPPNVPGYTPPKSGARKVRNPNGRGTGWVDRNGRVWVPDNHDGTHAPHWDVQNPKGGGYDPVYPFAQSDVDPSSSWPSFSINPTVLKVGAIIGIAVLIIATDGAAAPLLAL